MRGGELGRSPARILSAEDRRRGLSGVGGAFGRGEIDTEDTLGVDLSSFERFMGDWTLGSSETRPGGGNSGGDCVLDRGWMLLSRVRRLAKGSKMARSFHLLDDDGDQSSLVPSSGGIIFQGRMN